MRGFWQIVIGVYVIFQYGYAQDISLEKPQLLPKPAGNVQRLLYSSKGNYLGAIVQRHTILVYDREGQLARQYSAPLRSYWADMAFSPDESSIALAHTQNDSTFLQLYSLDTGELYFSTFLFSDALSVMEWHAQGQVLMCASEKRQLQAWQLEQNVLKKVHQTDWDKTDLDEAWAISATANGRLWALAGIGGEILLYEWKKQDINLRQTIRIDAPVYGIAFHPIEPILWVSLPHKLSAYQYQKREWRKGDTLATQSAVTNQLRFLPLGKGLVNVQKHTIVRYALQESENTLPTLLWESPAIILAHTFHPQGTKWAIATADGKLQLFFVRE